MPTISVIGYSGAGKSHFIALLYLHLNRLAQTDRDVKISVDVHSELLDIPAMAESITRSPGN